MVLNSDYYEEEDTFVMNEEDYIDTSLQSFEANFEEECNHKDLWGIYSPILLFYERNYWIMETHDWFHRNRVIQIRCHGFECQKSQNQPSDLRL